MTATDADLPANTLTFSLGAGSPKGARITPAGAFTWMPTEEQGPATYPIAVVVTDDGSPPLRDTNTFSVVVTGQLKEIRLTNLALSAEGKVSFAWEARPGRTYRVQFKNSLSEKDWTNIEPPINATAGTASFSESARGAEQRFYRIVQE